MKRFMRISILVLAMMQAGTMTAFAANGQGQGQGRTDTVNVNDYSTNDWDRFEYNYEFGSGPDTKETFGVPTESDEAAKNPQNANVRRNKDAAFVPPSYGVFSGDIPTDQSNPYITLDSPGGASNVTNTSSTTDSYYGNRDVSGGTYGDSGVLPSTSTMQTNQPQSGSSNVSVSYTGQVTNNDYLMMAPSYYEDGSIGSLSIPRLNLNVRVFEGETLESMKKGVGHFEFTSAWDGTVGIAGHNRGSAGYFEGAKNLRSGDEITYKTKYGTRVYVVYAVEKISDTDYSSLGWSNENKLVLITCVENQPAYRYAISARQK